MQAQGSPVPNGIQIGSERYKEIEALKKSIWNIPMHELLDITIEETHLDGRARYAKQLPVYNGVYSVWCNEKTRIYPLYGIRKILMFLKILRIQKTIDY